jgi:hypothetical protein
LEREIQAAGTRSAERVDKHEFVPSAGEQSATEIEIAVEMAEERWIPGVREHVGRYVGISRKKDIGMERRHHQHQGRSNQKGS